MYPSHFPTSDLFSRRREWPVDSNQIEVWVSNMCRLWAESSTLRLLIYAKPGPLEASGWSMTAKKKCVIDKDEVSSYLMMFYAVYESCESKCPYKPSEEVFPPLPLRRPQLLIHCTRTQKPRTSCLVITSGYQLH